MHKMRWLHVLQLRASWVSYLVYRTCWHRRCDRADRAHRSNWPDGSHRSGRIKRLDGTTRDQWHYGTYRRYGPNGRYRPHRTGRLRQNDRSDRTYGRNRPDGCGRTHRACRRYGKYGRHRACGTGRSHGRHRLNRRDRSGRPNRSHRPNGRYRSDRRHRRRRPAGCGRSYRRSGRMG